MSSDCETEAELPSQEDPHSEDLNNTDLTDFNDPTSTETNDEQPTDSAGNTTLVQDSSTLHISADEQTSEPNISLVHPSVGSEIAFGSIDSVDDALLVMAEATTMPLVPPTSPSSAPVDRLNPLRLDNEGISNHEYIERSDSEYSQLGATASRPPHPKP